jgi:hypothetical protein
MTARRRRKRPARPAATREARTSPGEPDTQTNESKKRKDAPADRPRGALAPSPYPGLGITLARGLGVTGSLPVILATAFLGLLATWATFVLLGAEASPRFLAVAMAISPANLFTDVPVAFAPGDTVRVVVSVVVLAVLRSVTAGMLVALIADAFEGRPSLRGAVRRLPRAGSTLAAVYLVEVGVVVVLLQLVAGFLGQLSLLVVAAAIYFLAFVPVIAVVENEGLQGSFRRSVRAARLPGTRHLTLVFLYFLFLFYAASISPFGTLTPATPSLLTWAFGLALTFLHVGVLGGLVFRWRAVRDQVPAGPAPPRRR